MKRLSLIVGTTGVVTLPIFETPIRISAVCVQATPAAGLECLVLTLLRAGSPAAQFQTPGGVFAAGSCPFTLAVGVNNNDAFLSASLPVPVNFATAPQGPLPPDLIVTPNDLVTIGFDTAPTSVDSNLIVSYEELER